MMMWALLKENVEKIITVFKAGGDQSMSYDRS